MKPVSTVTGRMVPLDRSDVDTDQIIPQQFLKRIERDGYGEFLFYNWAHTDDGTPSSDFIINDPARRGAKVLVTGPNFGCGSSREHAPWAIQQWGFEAVITPSAADIFRNNSSNVGLLVVELPQDVVSRLIDLAANPGSEVTIDLETQTVTADGIEEFFDIDPTAKNRLRRGLDPIGATLTHDDLISAHEEARDSWLPTTVEASPTS
ncbi:MAG TPA: 3-isopropylmalate dehydratase small subunit [Acidimicrobiia bacterium]|nr:3-isopropylmalate dehydratase small subunit [Acidimicrobiia bacterium]